MNQEFYEQEIEKQANTASSVIKAITTFAGKSAPKRILTGAAVGAGTKGLLYQPKYLQGQDVNGGRLKSMAFGAVGGGLAGGLVNKKSIKGIADTASKTGNDIFDFAANAMNKGFSQRTSSAIGNVGVKMGNFGNDINVLLNR